MVAAGKLHRVALRLIVGRVAVDHGLQIIVGGDNTLKVLILQHHIFQPMGALPYIMEKPSYIAGASAIAVAAAVIAVALQLIKRRGTAHIA